MLKERALFFTRLSVITDFLIVVAVYAIINYWYNCNLGYSVSLLKTIWLPFVSALVYTIAIYQKKLYESLRKITAFDALIKYAGVMMLANAVVICILYFVESKNYPRSFYIYFLFFSSLFIILKSMLIKASLHSIRIKGYNTRNLIVVGTKDKARELFELVDNHNEWGIKILGFVRTKTSLKHDIFCGLPVMGDLENIVNICKDNPVDEVIFCVPKEENFDAEEYVQLLEELGLTMQFVLNLMDATKYHKNVSMIQDKIPVITLHSKCLDTQQLFLKRVLDIIGGIVGLGITALFLPFIALAIKLDSKGPLFFGQIRVGENNRRFICWKFRSMYIDAEKRKAELMAKNEMNGAIFKIKDDPRVTKVGKIIRKLSIDELPQFWNVLKGEMSLVGTRPPTVDEVEKYENWQRKRIAIKPGITGMWQVSGRNELKDFNEIAKLDINYIDNWNIWLDMKLIAKTIYVVILRKGSC